MHAWYHSQSAMSKTHHFQPQEPKPKLRQIKRRKQWQAMQPPPQTYPEPEVEPWKVEG